MLEQVEALWKQYTSKFAPEVVIEVLTTNWPDDPNIRQERLQFDYPPAFQPGYVGSGYFSSKVRLLFLGYNPGEGKIWSSQQGDQKLLEKLRGFSNGTVSFREYNDFLSQHVLEWPIYRGRGLFLESTDESFSILPHELRPSIQNIALLNQFPFKTKNNELPVDGYTSNGRSLKADIWSQFTRPMIEALAPNIIVRYPKSQEYLKQLNTISSSPELVRVWHPSDRNVNPRRQEFLNTWAVLAQALRTTA